MIDITDHVITTCTKDKPIDITIPRKEKEVWNHVDAVLHPEEQDGEILSFRCPHCGDEWSVDLRF